MRSPALSTIECLKWASFASPFLGAFAIVWLARRYTLTEASGYRTKELLELLRNDAR